MLLRWLFAMLSLFLVLWLASLESGPISHIAGMLIAYLSGRDRENRAIQEKRKGDLDMFHGYV